MIRLLLFFVFLALVAWGGVYLVEHPGHIDVDWFGYQLQTSAALLIIAVAVVAIVAWIVLRFVFGLPSFISYAARRRRRERGYDALSRGLVAVHAGDARTAGRASAQATRRLRDDPLAMMLRAQSAQLSGDAQGAIEAYQEMAGREDTRLLGLRGLHTEASRRGDDEAAHHFASAAHKTQALPWTSQAQLDHHATTGNWKEALHTVEAGLSSRQLDKEIGERQAAVLETAIGYDKEMSEPEEALAYARSAIRRAPDLSPPAVLATRLLSRRGDIRKASKQAEKAWPHCPHPDLAEAYMDVRPGDSTKDRLSRARMLMGLSSYDPVGRMTVGRAALANTDYEAARDAMEPLVGEGKRPTVKMCLLMAELEEAEHGDTGLWREWLARASRAALDPAWMADGIVYDEWAPASPTTGRLDAFRWQVPAERPGLVMDALPPRGDPALSPSSRTSLPPANEARLAAPEPEAVSARHETESAPVAPKAEPAKQERPAKPEASSQTMFMRPAPPEPSPDGKEPEPAVEPPAAVLAPEPIESERSLYMRTASPPPSLYDSGDDVEASNGSTSISESHSNAAAIFATPSVPAHDVVVAGTATGPEPIEPDPTKPAPSREKAPATGIYSG